MKRRRIALKSTLVVAPGYGSANTSVGVYTQKKTSGQLIDERKVALKMRQEQILSKISDISMIDLVIHVLFWLELPQQTRKVVDEMLVDNGAIPDDEAFTSSLPDSFGSTINTGYDNDDDGDLPELSHEGGEYNDLAAAFSQQLGLKPYVIHPCTVSWNSNKLTEQEHAMTFELN